MGDGVARSSSPVALDDGDKELQQHFSPQVSSGGAARLTVSPEEIKLVQSFIECCLYKYMPKHEIVAALQAQASVEPAFSNIVWQELEKQNPEFFVAYAHRLKLKEQIATMNYLTQKQIRLMHKKGIFVPHSMPTQNVNPVHAGSSVVYNHRVGNLSSYGGEPWHPYHSITAPHANSYSGLPMEMMSASSAAYAQYNPYFASAAATPYGGYYPSGPTSQFAHISSVATPSNHLLNTSMNASFVETPIHNMSYGTFYHPFTPNPYNIPTHQQQSQFQSHNLMMVPPTVSKGSATPTVLYFSDTPHKDLGCRYD